MQFSTRTPLWNPLFFRPANELDAFSMGKCDVGATSFRSRYAGLLRSAKLGRRAVLELRHADESDWCAVFDIKAHTSKSGVLLVPFVRVQGHLTHKQKPTPLESP